MGRLAPAFRGRFTPRTEGRAFLARVAKRVEAGFLMGRPHSRSRYSVVSQSGDEIAIRSDGFWSDFNVGLNEISLKLARDGVVDYEVTFWRWLRGGVALSFALALALLLAYLLPLPEPWNIRSQLRAMPRGEREMGYAIFWGSLVWWGLLWPWVLSAFHRKPAESLLRRILGEVDAAGG
jgi:hypothetical protein